MRGRKLLVLVTLAAPAFCGALWADTEAKAKLATPPGQPLGPRSDEQATPKPEVH